MLFVSGQPIEFLTKESGLALGVVLSHSSKGIRLLLGNRKETTITERHVLHCGKPVKISISNLDECVTALGEIDLERKKRMNDISLEDLHALLAEDPRAYQIPELAGFIGSETDEHFVAALTRLLHQDRFYFRNKKDGFVPLSLAEVRDLKVREEARLRQEQAERALTQDIKNLLTHGPGALTDTLKSNLDELTEVLLWGEDARNGKKWLETLGKAGISSDRTLFSLLVKAGHLRENENLPLRKHKVPQVFPSHLAQEVADIHSAIPTVARTDLRHLDVWVIDNESTRDRDDGFSLTLHRDGAQTLSIHIADPAAFISPESGLWREASRRGTTLYFPDGNLPMFPPELSEDCLSLNPGTERPVLTQEITLSSTREITGVRFFPALIRVTHAISYAEADRLLSSDTSPLSPALTLADSLRQQRQATGAFSIPRKPETKLWVENGCISFTADPRESPSQEMVAEFMIWANHLAAAYCQEHQIPCLYRVQEAPPADLQAPDLFSPLAFYRIIRQLKRTSLSQQPGRHGCLGVQPYTQITSPLRRFGDLLLQRQIRLFATGGTPFTSDELQQAYMMAEEAVGLADEIMQKRHRYYLIAYLKQEGFGPKKPSPGTIVDVGNSDVQVYLHQTCEFGHCRKPGYELKPGQKVRILFTTLDPFEQVLKFDIDGPEPDEV
jgi:exoribonuclease-2